ncbi:MAG: hypothetical protein IKD14_02110 [Clostridia bacterium]|nr:hypothetical protein [Clostridia bacterium]
MYCPRASKGVGRGQEDFVVISRLHRPFFGGGNQAKACTALFFGGGIQAKACTALFFGGGIQAKSNILHQKQPIIDLLADF